MARRLRGNRLTVRLDRDPSGVRRRWLRAAKLGDTDAVVGLGVLLTDTNRAQACRWFQRAADAGRVGSMAGLANLAADNDLEQARRWLDQAAEAGEPLVIHILSSRHE